jgi:hypothetical protein
MKTLGFIQTSEKTVKQLKKLAINKKAFKQFLAEYSRLGRWSAKAENFFKIAFPNAVFNSNICLKKKSTIGGSGCVLQDENTLYVCKCNYTVAKYYNKLRGFEIAL